jgi:curved DNA-binding protein
MQERTLDVHIPKGIRPGQHLRLAGQGAPGVGGARAGDLYLEIDFNPHRLFRVDGADVYVDVPLAPWEAALGATVDVPTPEGTVQLTIPGLGGGPQAPPQGSRIAGKNPGDLYAVLAIVLPKADSEAGAAAYENLAKAFPDFSRARICKDDLHESSDLQRAARQRRRRGSRADDRRARPRLPHDRAAGRGLGP